MKTALLALAVVDVVWSYLDCSAPWEFAGPTGWVDGPQELQTVFESERTDQLGARVGSPSLPASASTHRIAAGLNGSFFVATGNGGVWRTKNISVAEPHWESVTDNQPVTCSSMAALDVASFNPKLVAAGCGGSTSGEMGETWNELISGEWKGVMISVDAGDTWAMTTFPENYNIGSVRFMEPTTLLVAARGNIFNEKDGGVWVSNDLGMSWTKSFDKPTVELLVVEEMGLIIAALGEDTEIAWQSKDQAKTWTSFSTGIDFGGYRPFYSHLASTGGSAPVAFLATYAVDPSNLSTDKSYLWYRNLGDSSASWTKVRNTPDSLDADKMPKDKIAVLPDPDDFSILYVAANVGNAFRVEWQTGRWTSLAGRDTSDGSEFHADCRHLAWDYATGDLLLTNDGGIHRRIMPKAKGGRWVGSAGDIQTMEYTYAGWDARNGRFVAGAQDNSVQITMPTPNTLAPPLKFRATGVVGGDGNRVLIDNVHCPARMFGSAQFLDGLSYVYGGSDGSLSAVDINIRSSFSSPYCFPYFVGASALNAQDPAQLYFYVNGTCSGKEQGVYKVTVPGKQGMTASSPELVAAVPAVLDVLAGGYTDGKPDASVLHMMATDRLYTSRAGKVTSVPLPMTFFTPVTLVANKLDTDWTLGPLTHGNSVFLTMSPEDSRTLALTGWPADINHGDEGVFFTTDNGQTFQNITGNLAQVAGVSARLRPQSVLLVTLGEVQAVLVGTVSGVYATFSDDFGAGWMRVGGLKSGSFPLVLNSGLSYEHYSDTLVAATYGRGVYVMKGAKQALLSVHDQLMKGSCDVPKPPVPASSAKFFPPMQSC